MAAKRVESFRVPCLDAGSTPATSTENQVVMRKNPVILRITGFSFCALYVLLGRIRKEFTWRIHGSCSWTSQVQVKVQENAVYFSVLQYFTLAKLVFLLIFVPSDFPINSS